ncbi:MAG: EAL domain-containing protein [Bacilli bacterium]|nr:EAL domain-containing protein [Bacilli bacterium]
MKKKRTVLIVEDNEINLEILCSIIESNYNVIKACNGREALDILSARSYEISLILTDVNMPLMNGYELIDNLKKDSKLSTIPVIVMTQSNSEEEELLALSHGANDFLPKPYRPQIILHRVSNLIAFRETASLMNAIQKDELTGVYTKEYFYERVKEVLANDSETDYCLICTNVENFKVYNDIFGQKAGDEMLVKIAKLITSFAGKEAIVGRLNSDRFLVLRKYEDEMRDRKSGRFNSVEGYETISFKSGIYKIIDRSISVSSMADRAKLACDSIKGSFEIHYCEYDDELRKKLLKDNAILETMELSLARREFKVFLQPKYDLNSCNPVGAEALVRWFHKDWGLVPPNEFIPLFEKNGFITKLDRYIFEEVFAFLANMKRQNMTLLPISINVSRIDFFRLDLVSIFDSLIKKYDIEPKYVHIEVTESAYSENTDVIIHTVDKLHELGLVIEMDDFGSGYSSLNMFSQMNIDILKLDINFIRNELDSKSRANIIAFVIELAHKKDIKVVAEGVETYPQARKLLDMGCEYAQGYYFSKPLEQDDYIKLVSNLSEESVEEEREVDKDNKDLILFIDDDENYFNILVDELKDRYEVINIKKDAELDEFLNSSAICEAVILNSSYNGVSKNILSKIRRSSKLFITPLLCLIDAPRSCLTSINIEEADDFLCKHHPISDLVKRIDSMVSTFKIKKRVKELSYEADHDYVTGLLNRRGLFHSLKDYVNGEGPFAVFIFDLDNLKKVNDVSGHETGDKVIALFANTILNANVEGDIIARYGGDEFLMISRNAYDKERVVGKGEEICLEFKKACENNNIDSSCSSGVVICLKKEEINSKIIDKADKSLYKAKAFKKGHCVIFDEKD